MSKYGLNIPSLHKKMKFSIKDFFTFTEEILNGKLHILCSECFNITLLFNSLTTNVSMVYKPVNWFAEQVRESLNGICIYKFMFFFKFIKDNLKISITIENTVRKENFFTNTLKSRCLPYMDKISCIFTNM